MGGLNPDWVASAVFSLSVIPVDALLSVGFTAALSLGTSFNPPGLALLVEGSSLVTARKGFSG